jgi:DNA replication ATP-dependent helicase Dna2
LTVEELSDYLGESDNKKILQKSAFLKHRVMRIDKQLSSLKKQRLIPYNSFATDMPKGENIRIILTVQRDQVSGKVFAASIYRIGGNEVFGSKSEKSHFISSRMEEEELTVREFVDKLYDILLTVHNFNSTKEEWKEKKSVQCYVTDNYEWDNILTMLNNLLEYEEYKEKVVNLLFYFHSDLLSEVDEHPKDVIPFPIIVLTTVVRRLFALPAHIAYRLEDLSKYIASQSEFAYEYKARDYLSFKLTNVMKSDLIHQVWNGGDTAKIEWIKSELERRLYLANSVIAGIREAAKDEKGDSLLFAWPEKFSLPTVMQYKHSILSKLSFVTRYETLLSYLEIRNARALPLNEREENGTTLNLTYLGGNLFRLNNIQITFELESVGNWIITEYNFAGELTHLNFYDYRYRDVGYPPKNSNLYYTSIEEINHQDDKVLVKLKMPRTQSKFRFFIGENYLVSKRFTDRTSKRVIGTLNQIDQEGHRVFELLTTPASFCKKFKPKWDEEKTKELIEKAGLTASQRKAFQQFLNYTLTLVWGPPGTGKTHFITTAVLLLSKIYQQRGKTLKILVSGFTHAAIKNCLVKIEQLKKDENIKVGKVKQLQLKKHRD